MVSGEFEEMEVGAVRVPELLLLPRELLERRAGDDVFDTGKTHRVGAGHVDGALDEVVVHDGAVMVGLGFSVSNISHPYQLT